MVPDLNKHIKENLSQKIKISENAYFGLTCLLKSKNTPPSQKIIFDIASFLIFTLISLSFCSHLLSPPMCKSASQIIEEIVGIGEKRR